ncbi:MAG: glycosyltransferase family 4 protein [Bacteroidota bacterium]|nr:glycosyltransferase family 4 protein [Bacteroidota bacterium]
MHICFITSEFPKQGFPHGGIGTFVLYIGTELVKNNIKVSVVGLNNYTKKSEFEKINGINVYRLFKENKLNIFKWYFNSKIISDKIEEIHSKERINIIETPENGLAFLRKLPDIKYIIRMHGGHAFFVHNKIRKVNYFKKITEKISFYRADHLIAVSDYVGQNTIKVVKANKNYTKIYNPIDTNIFKPLDNNQINNFSIFFAGTIFEKKGIRQLVQALQILIKNFPNTHLNIAGSYGVIQGTRKSYQSVLEKEISEDLSKHITFLGKLPHSEIPNYINQSTVCCYPSHIESFGIAVIEAMSMGKTVIFSDIGIGRELIDNFKNGILVNPHNPKDIAEKIKWVFDNLERAKEIGLNARKHVIENFDIRKIVDENINFYKSIL